MQTEHYISNFFYYLETKGITQKKYEQDNDLPLTTLSKWKKGISNPSIDQIKQAAIYFDITVNDLVYSKEEKKHIEVLKDTNYNPIIAQQFVKVTSYENIFKKPFIITMLASILMIIPLLINVLFISFSNYVSSLFLLSIPAILIYLLKVLPSKKTYIINYLDQVFFETNKLSNIFYKNQRLFIIINVSLNLLLLVSLKNFIDLTSNEVLSITYFIIIFSNILSMLDLIIKLKKNVSNILDSNEFNKYKTSLLSVVFSISTLFINIRVLISYKEINIFGLLLSLMSLLCAYIIMYYISKNNRNYKLTYKESNVSTRIIN